MLLFINNTTMKQLRGTELKRFNKQNSKHNFDILLILENIQYASNVAGIFRTADACGVREIFLAGSSHKPPFGAKLQKASRSKEKRIPWKYFPNVDKAVKQARHKGYEVVGLELTDESQDIDEFISKNRNYKLAIIVGNEAQGLTNNALNNLDSAIYIPMFGKGASLNVGVSTAVLLYKLILN